MFSKKIEETYEGTVERIGVVQESSNDGGRTCYAILLKGEVQPRIVDTQQRIGPDMFELRIRIALTSPGDYITARREGRYVVEFQNLSLAERLSDGMNATSVRSS